MTDERSGQTRPLMRSAAVALLAIVLAACTTGASTAPSGATSTEPSAATSAPPSAAASGATGEAIKIGYVSPKTGPLASFAAADDYIIAGVTEAIGAGIVGADGTTYPIEIVPKDSQSDPNRAAEVASELILDDGVDLIVTAGTPETTNPVSDTCEANGVPCISSVAPWQPWFLGRQAPGTAPPDSKPFEWTYHFFWGLEDIIAVFTDMWSQVENNKTVGFLMPNDGDGNAWSDPAVGFPFVLTTEAGWTIVDPGRYENLSQDYTSQITAFKNGNVEVLTGVPLPPDFTTFWKQAIQQGFKPRIASVGKALLFPESVNALGTDGEGLSTEIWWSPSHPFSSSLTQQSAKELADGYTTATTNQWTQPIGFVHALFEVALDSLERASSVDDKAAIRDAVKGTSLDTIVGKVAWDGANLPPFAVANVAKTPLVGGQWVKGTQFPYDLVIVSNKDHTNIPTSATLQPIPGS
jgi:branched-chain amino acid transport system substrate-binding protein